MLLRRIDNEDDRLKLERLYKQYRYLMYREANNILQDQYLAEDAVQQSVVKLVNHLHKIDEINCARTRNFMVIICVNVAKSICNQRVYLNKQDDMVQELDEDTVDAGSDPLDILIDKDSALRVAKAIEALSPIYRDVLLLKRTYQYSREEIANLLGISLETVKKRLLRARQILARTLEKEGLK